ncbi:hypothetical protein Pcinc_040492 [Petrolisthes cinctipes]|uniref:tubulin-glutamate carboxypeptidase n=1 Tax=Petrolisthes cinctipes TaxID=88211 RepID=A0AAE1BLU7_PETCI|nr:hypothetical protein Pcinc_040492 [Petrolisthes cinctipes]
MSNESGLNVTLERLAQGANRPADNVDLLKTLVTRLHARLKLQDCGSRLETLALLAPPDGTTLTHLVRIIELCRDPGLVGVTCSLIHDLLSPNSKGDVRQILLQQCLSLNTAEIIFRTLKTLAVDGLPTLDPCAHPAYQVIAKLASKDPKLAVKARLVGGVKLTHQLLQAHMKTTVPLLPLLMVTKYLAKNSTNQMMLGREGCVTTIVTILTSVPKTHHAKIKFIMEILALLTKTKSNVIRVVRECGLQRVLATLDGWEKLERRHQCKLVRATLATLSHVCDSKHGRKCVVSLSGVEILQRFIQTCPADCKFDSSLASATNVFLKCVSRGELPVTSVRGAFTFHLPHSLKEESTDTSNPVTVNPGLDGDYSDDDDGDDDDDDEVEDEGDDLDSTRSSADLHGIDLTTDYSFERPRMEELVKLAPLFPEYNGFRIPASTRFREIPVPASKGNNGGGGGESGGSWSGNCSSSGGGGGWEDPEVYLHMSSRTHSLVRFVKVAYPDLVGARGPTHLEQLYEKDRKVCRSKALGTVERVLHPEVYLERVVYDLDYLLASDDSHKTTHAPQRPLSNLDEKQIGKTDAAVTHLNFESRFESGNLRRVIQASTREYDLILNADVNSRHHHQWFYFEVSNMQAATPYVFNIINNEKPNSEFNFGMKPVMFSVRKATEGQGQWERTGYDICYHKNHYARIPKDYHYHQHQQHQHQQPQQPQQQQEKKIGVGGRRVGGSSGGGGQTNKCYYTATFTVVFPHDYDVCYLAYHYPYTYTRLQSYLNHLEERDLRNDVFFSNQVLCHTLNANPVPLLTITSHHDVKDKEVVLLTSRVHPGESNASWVLEGALELLLGDTPVAQTLRSNFIFKVVPMLNPEGVIHGK